MGYVNDANCYHRTTIVIDQFDDGSQELVKHEKEYLHPPCATGGCRASSFEQEACEFDPKTGLCGGRMA